MSKSLGNMIDPLPLVEEYGADTLRYFLLTEFPFNHDGDFSVLRLKERYNNELANDIVSPSEYISGSNLNSMV